MINHKGLSFPLFSFSFPVSLSLFLCLLSFSSHELWLSIVRDYRSIAGLWPVEDLLLIFICIWNKPILSCRWAAEPCGPIVCIYNMQEPVCVCVAVLWIYSMCHTLSVCVCVPAFHFWHLPLNPVVFQTTWATGNTSETTRGVSHQDYC